MVASKYVLTAAHCMFHQIHDPECPSNSTCQPIIVGKVTAEESYVVVRAHNRRETGETNLPRMRIGVKRIINHPNYDHPMNATPVAIRLGHDISILELEEEVELNIYYGATLSRIQLIVVKYFRVSLSEQPQFFFFDRTPKGVGQVCLKAGCV